MKRSGEFDSILNECLEQVLTKGETIEQCLAKHPEHAVELEPLLRTAQETKEAIAIKPRPEFRQRASHQFQTAIREMDFKKRRFTFSWQPRWAVVVTVVVILLLAGTGTVMAGGNSLPGEPLYQVKLATEAVRLALTPTALGKAELHIKLADNRVAEIIKMAEMGQPGHLEPTARRLSAELAAVASLAVPGGEEIAGGQVVTFEAVPPPVAEQVPPPLITMPAPAPAPAPAPVPPALAPPAEEAPAKSALRAKGPSGDEGESKTAEVDKGTKPEKQAGLKDILSRRAEENRRALQELLEKVPESVKPALRQAIEEADAGYERALSRLNN